MKILIAKEKQTIPSLKGVDILVRKGDIFKYDRASNTWVNEPETIRLNRDVDNETLYDFYYHTDEPEEYKLTSKALELCDDFVHIIDVFEEHHIFKGYDIFTELSNYIEYEKNIPTIIEVYSELQMILDTVSAHSSKRNHKKGVPSYVVQRDDIGVNLLIYLIDYDYLIPITNED